MVAKNLAARLPDGDTIIVVPIPPEVAQIIGCRSTAVVQLRHFGGGEFQVVPYTPDAPDEQKSTPTVSQLWEACSLWWAARGPKTDNTTRVET